MLKLTEPCWETLLESEKIRSIVVEPERLKRVGTSISCVHQNRSR